MAIGEFLSYEVFSSIPFMRHLTARIRCIFALLEMQTNILQQFKSLSRSRRKDRSVHFVGTFHFYSDPPLWMSTLRRQLVGIRFQRDRQKDQRVPTKKWGGRNLLIHRGGSEKKWNVPFLRFEEIWMVKKATWVCFCHFARFKFLKDWKCKSRKVILRRKGRFQAIKQWGKNMLGFNTPGLRHVAGNGELLPPDLF